MNTSLNFYQIAGNDISKLKWRRKQSYSWEGDNGEVLLVSGDKSQQSWVPAFPWACEAHTGKHRLGQPRVLSAASQQQNYGCKPAAPVLHQPLCLWQCRNTFPRAPSQRHSENTLKKIPEWILAISLGVFKLWYHHPEGKKMNSQIILFMSNTSTLAFVISRLTKPM